MRTLRPAYASRPANSVARLRLSTAEIRRLRSCQQPRFWTRQATGWSSRRPAPRFRRASDGVPVAHRSGPPTAAPSFASFGAPNLRGDRPQARRFHCCSLPPGTPRTPIVSLSASLGQARSRSRRRSEPPTAVAHGLCRKRSPPARAPCPTRYARQFLHDPLRPPSRRDPVSHQ